MVPLLINSLKKLTPDDCVTQAVHSSAQKLKQLEILNGYVKILIQVESTLKKKFCIAECSYDLGKVCKGDQHREISNEMDTVEENRAESSLMNERRKAAVIGNKAKYLCTNFRV